MKLLIAILLVIFSAKAWSAGHQDSLCRILARNKSDQKLIYICSGVLTAPDEITTAEHCVDDILSVEISVECGQSSIDKNHEAWEKTQSGNSVMTNGPKFKDKAHVLEAFIPQSNGGSYRIDLAKLKLNKQLSIAPIDKVTDAEFNTYFPNNGLGDQQALISEDASCISVGFGVASNGMSGLYKEVQYPNTYLVLLRQTGTNDKILGQYEILNNGIAFTKNVSDLIQATQNGMSSSEFSQGLNREFSKALAPIEFVQPGDSGGVILCKAKHQQEFKLVGISSKFSWGEELINNSAPSDQNLSKIFFQSIFERYIEKIDYIELSPRDIPAILRYHL